MYLTSGVYVTCTALLSDKPHCKYSVAQVASEHHTGQHWSSQCWHVKKEWVPHSWSIERPSCLVPSRATLMFGLWSAWRKLCWEISMEVSNQPEWCFLRVCLPLPFFCRVKATAPPPSPPQAYLPRPASQTFPDTLGFLWFLRHARHTLTSGLLYL